jgi:hypothetical protein
MSKARLQRETVKNLTYFVVQTFSAVKGSKTKINADTPMEARDEQHARRLIERYRPIRAGVVAFHRTGDPKTGDWEEGVLIARHGLVSAEYDGMPEADEPEFDSGDLTDVDLKVA